MTSIGSLTRGATALALFALASGAHAQGFLESLEKALGSGLGSLGTLFRQKSTLEPPPAKLPETVLTHPAFQAPPPAVLSLEMRPRSSWNWPFGLAEVEKIRPGERSSHSVFGALSASGGFKNAAAEVADYRQGIHALAGLHPVFAQRREAASQNEQLKFVWSRMEAVEIRDVSGALFPIAVGNILAFTQAQKGSDDRTATVQYRYTVAEALAAKAAYPRLSGRLFRITSTVDGRQDCEYLWSEQLRYRLTAHCPGSSAERTELIALDLSPEGLQLAEQLRRSDEQAERDEQFRREEAARIEKERLIAEEERRRAEEARRYADDINAKKRKSASLSQPDVDRALRMFDQAMDFYKQGQFDAAVLRFKDGLEIDPANGLAHYYLAETLVRQKKDFDAKQHYRWTVDFSPDEKEAVLARVKLK